MIEKCMVNPFCRWNLLWVQTSRGSMQRGSHRKPGHRLNVRQIFHMLILGVAMLLATPAWSQPEVKPLKVVATFSIIADMVKVIGGDMIDVTALVGPDGDMHSYEPSPADVETVYGADVLFANGLGFETWLSRVVASSGFSGDLVTVSKGVVPRILTVAEQHEHQAKHTDHGAPHEAADSHTHPEPGMIDPHAWQSVINGIIYAENIVQALERADPGHAKDYRSRGADYVDRLMRLDAGIRDGLAAIPVEQRHVITAHDAFGYFADEYEVQFTPLMGLSSEAEPSARGLARLIDSIRQQPGAVVFRERATNPRLIEQIARETGAPIGGVLFSDALGKPDEPAGTYLGMLSWNAGQLMYAFDQAKSPQALFD